MYRAVFKGRTAPQREGAPTATDVLGDAAAAGLGIGRVSTCSRPIGKSSLYVCLEVVVLEMVQGKRSERAHRPQPGLQARPEQSREDQVEVEVQCSRTPSSTKVRVL